MIAVRLEALNYGMPLNSDLSLMDHICMVKESMHIRVEAPDPTLWCLHYFQAKDMKHRLQSRRYWVF